MNAAELEVIISAKVNDAIQNINNFNTKLDQTKISAGDVSNAVNKVNANLNVISTTAAKAGQAFATQNRVINETVTATNNVVNNTSKFSNVLENSATKISTSNEVIAKGFQEIDDSFDDFASQFNAKWNPIVEGAERLARPLDEASDKMENLGNSFSTVGSKIGQLGQGFNTDELSRNLSDASNSATKLSGSLSGLATQGDTFISLNEGVRTLLLSIEGLDPAIRQFAESGRGSITQLEAAFNALQDAAQLTTDPIQISKLETASAGLATQINNARNAASSLSPALEQASQQSNNLSQNFSGSALSATKLGTALDGLGQQQTGFIRISDSVRSVLLSVQELNPAVVRLAQDGGGSIQQLEQAFIELKNAAQSTTDTTQTNTLTIATEELSVQITNVKNSAQTLGPTLNEISQQTQNLATGTSNLTQTFSESTASISGFNTSLSSISQQQGGFVVLNSEVQTFLLSLEGLEPSIREFAEAGRGDLAQLESAFDALKNATLFTADPEQLSKWGSVTQQVSIQIEDARKSASSLEPVLQDISRGATQITTSTSESASSLVQLQSALNVVFNSIQDQGSGFLKLSDEAKAFLLSLEGLPAAVQEFAQAGGGSVMQLENAFISLQDAMNITTNPEQIIVLESAINTLQGNIDTTVVSANNLTPALNEIGLRTKELAGNTNDLTKNLAGTAISVNQLDSSLDSISPASLGSVIEILVQMQARFLTLNDGVRELLLNMEGLSPAVRQLAIDGTGSVAQLEQAFRALQEAAIISTDPQDILNFNLAASQLATQLNNARAGAVAFATDLHQITPGAQAVLQSINNLDPALQELATTGKGNVLQLEQAFIALKNAASGRIGTGAVDATQANTYAKVLEQLSKQLNTVKTSAANVSPALGKIAPNANAGQYAIGNLSRVLQDLPYGFIGISNNLNPLLESFQALQRQAKATGTSLTANLLGALKTGGIGLALAGITTAVSFATIGFQAWTRGMGGAKKQMDDLTSSTEAYNKALEDITNNISKSAGQQIGAFDLLINTIRDSTVSLSERNDAVTKLQEQFPKYFSNLSQESILYGDITEAVNKTTEAILARAQAEGAQEKVKQSAGRIVDLIDQQGQATERLNKAQAAYDKAVSNPQIGQAIVGYTQSLKSAQNAYDEISVALQKAQEQQRRFLNQATDYSKLAGGVSSVERISNELLRTIQSIDKRSISIGINLDTEKISAYKKAINDLVNAGLDPTSSQIKTLIALVRNLGGSFDESRGSAAKSVESIREILANLQTQLETLNSIQLELGADKGTEKLDALNKALSKIQDTSESTRNKISGISEVVRELNSIETGDLAKRLGVLQTAMEALVTLKVPRGDTLLEKLIGDFQSISLRKVAEDFQKAFANIEIPAPKFADTKLAVPIEYVLSSESAQRSLLMAQIQRLSKRLQIDIPVNLKFMSTEELENYFKQIQETVGKIQDEFNALNETMQGTVRDMVGTFAEGLGEALAGGTPDIFGNIGKVLGAGISKLGEQMMLLSPLLASIKLAFESLNPVVLFGAGIALKVIGTAIQASLNKAVPFEEGGIVTAPVLGLIGERGREVVLPLDRIHEVLKLDNNSQVFITENRVSGQDLVTIFKRAEGHNRRTF